MTKWYAVQRYGGDDWDNGSFNYDEAVEMLKEQGYGLIAVIEDGKVCIEEIEFSEAVTKFQFEAVGDYNMLFADACDGSYHIRADVEVPEGASEDYGYLAMKKAILEVLTDSERKKVVFWYDGQEQLLAEDANSGSPNVDVERF